jgi:hypothetical protein
MNERELEMVLAVVIDPVVCQSSYWWLFVECYGIAIMSGHTLGSLLGACVCVLAVKVPRGLRVAR